MGTGMGTTHQAGYEYNRMYAMHGDGLDSLGDVFRAYGRILCAVRMGMTVRRLCA
jgi:hypothetical protein